MTGRGPALVIVPMDDWLAPAGEEAEVPAPDRLLRSRAADPAAVEELAALIAEARSPALVVGAGADRPETWAALVELAERLGAPVWQEAFGARAGFPQDHPAFAGQLPADRPRLRRTLAGHDLVLAVGAPVFRQYPFMPGPLVAAGTRVAIVTDEPAEAHRSPADLALLADPAAVCGALAALVEPRPGRDAAPAPRPARRPAAARPGRAAARRARLRRAGRPPARRRDRRRGVARRAGRSSRCASRPARRSASSAPRWAASASRCPARRACAWRGPIARSSPSSATARRCTRCRRSGARRATASASCSSSSPTAATRSWTASPSATAQDAPWPAFEDVRLATIAAGLGCPARRIEDHATLLAVLDEVVPGLAGRGEPLLLDVAVEADPTFAP